MAKFTRRYWLAITLLIVGLLIASEGFRWQGRPRTNFDDNISWFVWGLGMSLIAAGITLLFAKLARAAVVIPIAIACPFAAFTLLVVLYWGSIVLQFGAWPGQAAMVASGYSKIPEAKQIDDLFGPAWHFTANYQDPNVVQWFTVALFGGRYELTMSVNVEIDRGTGEIVRLVDEPTFFLQEISSVLGGSVSFADEHEFSADDWRKVVAANGDFSVIGIPMKLNSPIPEWHCRAAVGARIELGVAGVFS